MKQWTYARIDRVDSSVVHCVFCGRALRSGKVVVLYDDQGQEVYSGPSCAKKTLGDPEVQLIDLSKLALLVVETEPKSPNPAPQRKSKHPRRESEPADAAVEYLRLRVEVMKSFAGNVTKRLSEIHAAMVSSKQLSDDGRQYIQRLLANAAAANTIYSSRNVKSCVGVAYWIGVAIEHTPEPRRDFLQGLLHQLEDRWRLSSGQIEALNRWGAGITVNKMRFPKLDVDAFAGVTAPIFAKGQKRDS